MPHEERIKILSCAIPKLSDLTGCAKGLAAGFGVSLFVCVTVFAYPEFCVSFKSHLRRRNFWSIWNHLQVIREQPCFFPSSAVCHSPADISKRSVRIGARWRVSCIFSCCLGEKSDEPKCMFIFRQRKRRTEKKQAHCDRISESLVMKWNDQSMRGRLKRSCYSADGSSVESCCMLKTYTLKPEVMMLFFIPWPLDGTLVSLYCFLNESDTFLKVICYELQGARDLPTIFLI